MIKSLSQLSTIVLNQVNNVTDLYSKLYKIIPCQCLLCHSDIFGSQICDECNNILPRLSNNCYLCGWPIPEHMESCAQCIELPDDISVKVAASYSSPLDKLIHQFKYSQNLSVGRLLADLLYQQISCTKINNIAMPHGIPDVILPVPLFKKKLAERGFNQCVELGTYLSKKTGIKLDTSLIAKYRATSSQMGQDKLTRSQNLKDSFCFNYKPRYQSVVILDDVITTGSTMRELINLLYKANIRRITVWAVARVL